MFSGLIKWTKFREWLDNFLLEVKAESKTSAQQQCW
jgi:hypothetical protein